MQVSFLFRNDAFTSKKGVIFFSSAAASLVVLTVVQDLLLSLRNNNSFYWTESLLFNTFWLWFIPVSFFLWKTARQKPVSNSGRIIFQAARFVLLGSLIHAIVYASTVTVGSYLLFDHTYGTRKVLTYTIANDLYKYLLIYGLLFFLHYRSRVLAKVNPVLKQPETGAFIAELVIEQGKEHIVVPTNEIVMICSASPYIMIHTGKKKYLYTSTLRAVAEQLDQAVFVRVHKSTIINTRYVTSYRSRLNGDYDILLHNEQETRLSRNYVQAFKQIISGRSSC